MPEPLSHHCPNCSAPVEVPLGEVEVFCEYCDSQLKFIPEAEELEVVRTREEMKYRERVAVEKQILRNKLHREEMDRWRETAAKVAIASVPVVGRTAGRALFNHAVSRGSGCGCLGILGALAAALLAM
ncbi:MAG: hypothetical protein V2I67_00865 [Thermoanaerobaculales bacterium]|jgi:uncharacterized Zn finger protein (UPF0148 family)|nr:hypothetical protein [Thermoanaerobaculales bacterium]